ncbi:hypothetical protein GGR55DRAFT_638742 [Xylaria sp. FL0064]|nr:hypothetical protein GGR55DRAFT_638742 [Xylaria sp. FL0064]
MPIVMLSIIPATIFVGFLTTISGTSNVATAALTQVDDCNCITSRGLTMGTEANQEIIEASLTAHPNATEGYPIPSPILLLAGSRLYLDDTTVGNWLWSIVVAPDLYLSLCQT